MSTRTASAGASHDGRFGRRHAAAAAHALEDHEVHRITDAVIPLEVDQARRMKRYLIQMGIRVLCFIAAFVAYELYPNPLLVLGLIGAAAVLPYIAVVGANAGRERSEGAGTFVHVSHPPLSGLRTEPSEDVPEASENPSSAQRYDLEITPPDDATPDDDASSTPGTTQNGPAER